MKKLLFAIACALTSFASFAQLVGPQPWLFTGPQITIGGGASNIALLFGNTGSIILPKGGTGTFARASTATVTDWEGIVRYIKSGEMRMSGWRRVENLLTSGSNDLTATFWSASSGVSRTPTRMTLTVDTPGANSGIKSVVAGNPSFKKYRFSFIAAANKAGSIKVIHFPSSPNDFSHPPSSTIVPITTTPRRYTSDLVSIGSSASANMAFQILMSETSSFVNGDWVDVSNVLIEDVSGQGNTNPSSAVSVGVLAAPYHGAGIDGVKYFAVTNGNTVDGNRVVTEAAGVPLHPTYYEPAIKASVWATYKPWTASESTLSSGSRRIPSQNLFPAGGNGYWYYVSTFASANTGATEPTWPTTIGATVADSSGNTWTNGGYYRIDGYLAEPQRTNLGRYGNDPTNVTYWANVDSTPTLNSVQSPDGRTNSTLITEGSAGTAILAQSVKTVSAGSRQAMGVWLKRGNTDWVEVGMRNTGATNGFRVWVNLATGAVGTANTWGTATNEAAYVEAQGLNSHWRVVLVGKLAAGDTTAQPYVRSATANGTSTRVNGATYYQYRLQHVVDGSITSDIPNDGATDITRVSDSLTYPEQTRLSEAGVAYAIFRSEYPRVPATTVAPRVVHLGTQGRIGNYSATPAYAFVHDSTSEASLTSGLPMSVHGPIAGRWASSGIRAFKNNASSSILSFDGQFSNGVIQIGGPSSHQPLSGAVRSVALLFTPPIDAALQAATQWHNY